MSHTPSRTQRGSGRGGAGRSASKSAPKRHGSTRVMNSALAGISKGDYKRLARRAGIKRIANDCFDLEQGIAQSLDGFLRKALDRIVTVVEHACRFTATTNDVAYAVKQMGMTVYKKGLDWNNGFYTRRRFSRARIVRPLPRQRLQEAAAARARSEAAAARERSEAAAAQARIEAAAAAPAATEVAEAGFEAAAMAAAAGQPGEATGEAALASAAAAAAVQQLQQRWEEEAVAAGAGAAEDSVAWPAASVLSVVCCAGKGRAPDSPSATVAASQGLSVPTPDVQAPSVARSLEIQGWMYDELERLASENGYVSKRDLQELMWRKHTCTAAEVEVVLSALEKEGDILMDDGYICPSRCL